MAHEVYLFDARNLECITVRYQIDNHSMVFISARRNGLVFRMGDFFTIGDADLFKGTERKEIFHRIVQRIPPILFRHLEQPWQPPNLGKSIRILSVALEMKDRWFHSQVMHDDQTEMPKEVEEFLRETIMVSEHWYRKSKTRKEGFVTNGYLIDPQFKNLLFVETPEGEIGGLDSDDSEEETSEYEKSSSEGPAKKKDRNRSKKNKKRRKK